MRQGTANNLKFFFTLMWLFGLMFLARGDSPRPLTLAYRIALVVIGGIGFIVVSFLPFQRSDQDKDVQQPEGTRQTVIAATPATPATPAWRWLLALGIVIAVFVGIVLLAKFTSG